MQSADGVVAVAEREVHVAGRLAAADLEVAVAAGDGDIGVVGDQEPTAARTGHDAGVAGAAREATVGNIEPDRAGGRVYDGGIVGRSDGGQIGVNVQDLVAGAAGRRACAAANRIGRRCPKVGPDRFQDVERGLITNRVAVVIECGAGCTTAREGCHNFPVSSLCLPARATKLKISEPTHSAVPQEKASVNWL